jgi:histone acetyltransferase (RNA polymerase elongator complex component)
LSDQRPRKPLIVPVFIPNQGCPHRCIFCQQEKITAQPIRPISGQEVKETLERAIGSAGFDVSKEPEVAFYGGTFTGLPVEKISELLEAVKPFVAQGYFKSIRVSTRPDALDGQRAEWIRHLGVTTVELGSQSMDDMVLGLSRRGHTAKDTVEAVHILRHHGFKVGIQLMPGLPGDSEESFMRTVEEVLTLHPDMVRLYPTVVIRGTELEAWYLEGRYRPLSLEEAVRICRMSCIHLEGEGIPVIRIGLMSSPSLLERGEIVAGPWHEAFGFLVRSAIHQEKIEPYLPAPGEAREITLRVPRREIPLVRGYKNTGLRVIEEKTGASIMEVLPDEGLAPGQIGVDKP